MLIPEIGFVGKWIVGSTNVANLVGSGLNGPHTLTAISLIRSHGLTPVVSVSTAAIRGMDFQSSGQFPPIVTGFDFIAPFPMTSTVAPECDSKNDRLLWHHGRKR